MDDLLARDFGYRPQGKSAPMKSEAANRRPSAVRSSSSSSSPMFNDVFGGSPKFANPSNKQHSSVNDFDYDSIFKNNNNKSNINNRNSNDSKTSSSPGYDKPVYDDDIFEGLPGLKSKSVSRMKFEDNAFASMASPAKQNTRINYQFDDLLGNLGSKENGANKGKNMRSSNNVRGFDDLLGNYGRNEKVPEPKSRSSSSRGIDDLLGGFGSGSPASARTTPESHRPPKSTTSMDDPFVVLESTSTPESSSSGVFTDPLDEISNLGKSGSSKANASSVSGGTLDDLDPLHGFGKSVPLLSSEKFGKEDRSPSRMGPGTHTSSSRGHSERYSEAHSQKKVHVENLEESSLFDMPTVSMDSQSSISQNDFSPGFASTNLNEKNFQADISSNFGQAKSDDIWLSVSEVPLFTQPTKAPPPSRPPPPIPRRTSKENGGFFSPNFRNKGDGYSPSYSSHAERLKPTRPEGRSHPASQIDELEDFVMGRAENTVEENANIQSSKQMDGAAAAMKEAMDRAEARFKHAKEVREREHAKAARSTETVQMEKDEHVDNREREFKDNEVRLQRERRQREKEEEERKQRRLEKERERARQAEIERQAVERATREARERAVAEARARAERSAAEKAQAEARERAERSAVHRAQAEARGRAAAEARERAEKAAAEAKERANGEAREKEAQGKAEARRRAERAAANKAAAEARERAATEARERDAAAARNQQKNENDLESFFSTRPSSVPKDPVFDSQSQSKGGPDSAKRTSSTAVSSSNIKKTSSTSNLVDDLSSIFGAPPSSGEFQEVEGESEERRRARLERHQRTQERAAKALAEKNQRDLQAQRDQEERHRIAETLDFEIKRWAAGKEGNLRALLSTLQYVLWPECGWQPVSLTDLITGASVKKMYRKATLCIHPDKVQQKGANLQQKYIAEKVFDLLKEAWNKFNSEELF